MIVVDEASMVGTPELRSAAEASTAAHAKMVLVGDAYQLAPVKARGGMFEQLCADLPWSQRLAEVWRMRDPDERDASLALRSGHGNRLRKAVGWYRTHDRLHTGDAVAMAADATTAYITARADGKDAAIICDTWEIADAINQRLHDLCTDPSAASVRVRPRSAGARRRPDPEPPQRRHRRGRPGPQHRRGVAVDQVRNGNRWRVAGVDDAARAASPPNGSPTTPASCSRATTCASTSPWVMPSTVHSAQGMTVGNSTTAGVCWTILSDRASRAMAYVGDDPRPRRKPPGHLPGGHQRSPPHRGDLGMHQLRRGTKHAAAAALHMILRQRRPPPRHARRGRTHRPRAPPRPVAALLDRNDQRRARRAQAWRQHTAQAHAREAAYQRLGATRHEHLGRERSRGRNRGYGLEL